MLNTGLQDLYDEHFQRDVAWIASEAAGTFGRCGRPLRRLGVVGEMQLGGGLLSWIEGNWVHVLRLRDGKQYIAAGASSFHRSVISTASPLPGHCCSESEQQHRARQLDARPGMKMPLEAGRTDRDDWPRRFRRLARRSLRGRFGAVSRRL
jgi:hypothetical protein